MPTPPPPPSPAPAPVPRPPEAAEGRVVLVSACLLGVACRYDGRAKPLEGLARATPGLTLVPICPEELGALRTPRPRAELRDGDGRDVLDGRASVVDEHGRDVTAPFLKGAARAASIARAVGATEAWLTERSPSCGVSATHADGALVAGPGVTAAALARAGLVVRGLDASDPIRSIARATAPPSVRTIRP